MGHSSGDTGGADSPMGSNGGDTPIPAIAPIVSSEMETNPINLQPTASIEDTQMYELNRCKRDHDEAQTPFQYVKPPPPQPWNAGALVQSALQSAAAPAPSQSTEMEQAAAPSQSTEMVEFGAGKKKAKATGQGVLMEGNPDVWPDDKSLLLPFLGYFWANYFSFYVEIRYVSTA